MRLFARAAALVVAAASLAVGCARPGAPSGGVRDVRPPVVVSTTPEPNATVPGLDPVVVFRFNERISERPRQGTLDEAVLISPLPAGAVRVKHGSDRLEVRVEGGLRRDVVYRFTLQPVIADLFSNAMREPFELVLSTGAPLTSNAVAGQVLDGVTGRGVANAEVQLHPIAAQSDTLRHVARTDAAGLYVFRYVPGGRYALVAFTDRNRNHALDVATEASGRRGLNLSDRDTLYADVAILEPDTTRARVTRAEMVDSLTLRVFFDDYLDPEPLSLAAIAVSVTPPEGSPMPSVTEVIHPATLDARRDSAQRAADMSRVSAPRAAPSPGTGVSAPGQERGGLPRGVPLPRQEVIVTLDRPLEVGVPHKVLVTGAVNVRGLPSGGGEATVTRAAVRTPTVPAVPQANPPAPRPDSAAAPPR